MARNIKFENLTDLGKKMATFATFSLIEETIESYIKRTAGGARTLGQIIDSGEDKDNLMQNLLYFTLREFDFIRENLSSNKARQSASIENAINHYSDKLRLALRKILIIVKEPIGWPNKKIDVNKPLEDIDLKTEIILEFKDLSTDELDLVKKAFFGGEVRSTIKDENDQDILVNEIMSPTKGYNKNLIDKHISSSMKQWVKDNLTKPSRLSDIFKDLTKNLANIESSPGGSP